MISVVVISKNEPGLGETIDRLIAQTQDLSEEAELVVVDASDDPSMARAADFPNVRWIDYEPPARVGISIPQQRNLGVASALGDVIIFTDASCLPRNGWLERMVGALRAGGDSLVAGVTVAPEGRPDYYARTLGAERKGEWLGEAPTMNLGFRRAVFEELAGFDEAFAYGSDLDFTWRAVDRGFRIRLDREAIVEHDWGPHRRQLKRAYLYGRAKAHLYRKHASRRAGIWRRDPMLIAYPLFMLGLPIVAWLPAYPLLLAVPAWRARGEHPVMVVADHLAFGVGVLAEVAAQGRVRLSVSDGRSCCRRR